MQVGDGQCHTVPNVVPVAGPAEQEKALHQATGLLTILWGGSIIKAHKHKASASNLARIEFLLGNDEVKICPKTMRFQSHLLG